ncbi:MAG: hypothetical protein MUO68_15450 [Desulfobacteraceae bacterium]|jgi:hypothetical protein|nr:hypothetical protein [Desulfobacteraceae bacterium]
MWKKRFKGAEAQRHKVEDRCYDAGPGYVFHVMAMGEQSVDFAKIGISDNF